MKLLICTVIAAMVGLLSLFNSGPERAVSTAPIEEMLQAHGGDALSAINSYRIEMTKIVNTIPPKFFVQRVRLSVEGNKIKRLTSDTRGDRIRVEMIDESGQFHAVAINQYEEDGSQGSPLSTAAQRQSAVRANVAVCSLIPFLKAFSGPAASASYIGRERGGMDKYDKYLVAASGREFVVYLDQSHLIRRVEMGRNTFEFADFKRVGSLRLPFVERVSIDKRQVFEFFFSGFEINPSFPSDHFSRAAVEK